MGRFIAEVMIPIMVICALIYYAVSYHMLKRKMASLDDPRLALPRRERRAWARKQLQQRDDEYKQQQMEFLTNYINERTPQPHEK